MLPLFGHQFGLHCAPNLIPTHPSTLKKIFLLNSKFWGSLVCCQWTFGRARKQWEWDEIAKCSFFLFSFGRINALFVSIMLNSETRLKVFMSESLFLGEAFALLADSLFCVANQIFSVPFCGTNFTFWTAICTMTHGHSVA